MITDFPDVKKELNKSVSAFLRQKFKENATVFSIGRKKSLYEGDKMGILHVDGRHSVSYLQSAQSEFSISKKDIPTMKAEDLLNNVTALAEDLAGQVEHGLLKKLNEAIEEGGNIIHHTSELGPELILNGLEMIVVDFEDDDRAKPIKPSILAGPNTIEKLINQISKSTPEEKEAFHQKEQLILDKKHAEHLEDLESRKIVD
ncbi:MAG: hypothetical protein IPM36_00040 [Lewinellaceae bacterium]|nr:hypothetical protein [Lewinellaceae bacterium]